MAINWGRSAAFALLATAATEAWALDFRSARVAIYAKGEEIGGEEFLTATEEVADVFATFQRPTSRLEAKMYRCQVKDRVITPYVTNLGGSDPYSRYVTVRMLYAIKDCAPES